MRTVKRTDLPTIEVVETMISDPALCGLAVNDFRARAVAKILIFSAFVGEDETQLSLMSGEDLLRTQEVCEALKKAGVFGTGVNHFEDYFRGEGMGITFNCDLACGQGMLKRSMKDGKATWQMTEQGSDYVQNDLLKNPEA